MLSSSFLLLFEQLSLGGLFALAVPPFHEMTRGFYKSSAAVLFAIAVLGFWGKTDLYLRNPDSASWIKISLFAVFILFFLFYLTALWTETPKFRARVFSLAWLTGLALLIVDSFAYQTSLLSIETFLFPLSLFFSALLLGAAMIGMLIGHWYLIDTGQSLEPFIRVFKYFVALLVLQTAFLAVFALLIYLFGTPRSLLSLEAVWKEHRLLLVARVMLTYLGPLILSKMIWQTLKQPRGRHRMGYLKRLPYHLRQDQWA